VSQGIQCSKLYEDNVSPETTARRTGKLGATLHSSQTQRSSEVVPTCSVYDRFARVGASASQSLSGWGQMLEMRWCLHVVILTGQGRAGHGRAGQGRAWQGRAGQGRAQYGCTTWKALLHLECDLPVPLEVDDSTHCWQAKHHLRASFILPPLQKGFQESFIISCHRISNIHHMSLYFHHARPVTTLSCTHLDVISALQVCSITDAMRVRNDTFQPLVNWIC
jgi:hypothetical protein